MLNPQPAARRILVAHKQHIANAGMQGALDSSRLALLVDCCDPSHPYFASLLAGAHLLVTDYSNGIEACRKLQRVPLPGRERQPSVMIVSNRDGEVAIRHAFEAGVKGYVLLSADLDAFVDGVERVYAGERFVCGRPCEMQIAKSATITRARC